MLSLAVFAACTPDATDVTATGASSPRVDAVLIASIDGPEGEAFVEYGLDGFDSATPPSAAASHHEIAVIGLKAGSAYKWRAVVVDADGERYESAEAVFEVPDAPALLRGASVVVNEPDAELGFFFANLIYTGDTSYAAIVDRDGDFVWWVDSGGFVIETPELGIDGASVVWSQYAFDKVTDAGLLVRQSLDGRTRTETRMVLGHHDFVQHDDGTVAFLSLEPRTVSVGGQDYDMVSDTILTGPEGMTDADTPTRLFSMFDDFPLQPEVTCPHISSLDFEVGQDGKVAEWTHANSLMYLPETDRYYVNDKFTDWLFAIERATGEVAWILNGRTTNGGDPIDTPTFTTPTGDPLWTEAEQTALWSHGHMSDLWDGGGLMFDNGDHHVPGVTRAMEFQWDEVALTAESVWTFDEPNGHVTAALGDVRRLPGGHRLITWSGEPGNGYIGPVTEVDPATDRIVWRFEPPPGGQVARLVPFVDPYTLR
ncbi:MAG: aryl-sulfate sulfotransferase [Myxococcota bacterium]